MVVGEEFQLGRTHIDADDVSHVEWRSNAFDCPAGTMEVVTFVGDDRAPSGGETDLGGFDLTVNGVGFTFVIP